MVFVLCEEHFVTRTDHESRTEWEGPRPGAVLPVPAGEGSGSRDDGRATEQGRGADRAGFDRFRGVAVLVEEDRKRELLVLDERLCEMASAGTDCGDGGIGEVVSTFADLTGPLPARQSAEVTQKQQRMGTLLPELSEHDGVAVWIRKFDVCECRHVGCHAAKLAAAP